jgi:hypothetical protein
VALLTPCDVGISYRCGEHWYHLLMIAGQCLRGVKWFEISIEGKEEGKIQLKSNSIGWKEKSTKSMVHIINLTLKLKILPIQSMDQPNFSQINLFLSDHDRQPWLIDFCNNLSLYFHFHFHYDLDEFQIRRLFPMVYEFLIFFVSLHRFFYSLFNCFLISYQLCQNYKNHNPLYANQNLKVTKSIEQKLNGMKKIIVINVQVSYKEW